MARLLVIFSMCIAGTLSRSNYRSLIPNGYAVPNPCLVGQVWNAVGHMHWGSNFQQRNPFGQAFARNGAIWTPELCMQDSDGDGISNGEELGDPSCSWRPGAREQTQPTGHPGICEPVGSPNCAAQGFSCAPRLQPRMPPQMQPRPQSPFQQPFPPQMQPRPQSPFQQPFPPQMQPRLQSPFQQPFPPQMQPRPQSPFQQLPSLMQPRPQSPFQQLPPLMQLRPQSQFQAFLPAQMMPAPVQSNFPQIPLAPNPAQVPSRPTSQQQAEFSQTWFGQGQGQGQIANWFSDFFNPNRPNQFQ